MFIPSIDIHIPVDLQTHYLIYIYVFLLYTSYTEHVYFCGLTARIVAFSGPDFPFGKQSMDGKSVVVQLVEEPAVLRFFKGEI